MNPLLIAGYNWFKNRYSGTDSVRADQNFDGQYGDLRNADPYANFDYRMGPFEGFLRSLGFRTKYDKQKEELALASQAYQADVTQKAYDEAYDSPVAQAQRMRSAGLNPDLQGTSGVQSAAAMSSEDNPMAAVADADTLGDPMTFGNFIMSSLTAAVGLSKDFMSLKSINLANESQSIGNAGSLMNLAFDTIMNYTPSIRELELGDADRESGSTFNSFITKDKPLMLSQIEKDYQGAFSNKKQYKMFLSNVSSMIDSLPTELEQYKKYRERAEARRGYFREVTRPDYSESDEVIYGISQILSRYAYDAYEKDLKNDIKEQDVRSEHLQNQEDYEQAFNGTLAAQAENSANALTVNSNEVRNTLQNTLGDIMHYLKSQSEKGNRFASIALSIISLGSLMNVGVGSSGLSVGLK